MAARTTSNPAPAPASQPAGFRAPSNFTFYFGLIVLSGVYVLLIVGMLLAEVLFLHPPTDLVLLVPKDNPRAIAVVEDLANNELRIGLIDPESSPAGATTRDLLHVWWVGEAVYEAKRKHPLVLTDDPKELVKKVGLGQLDVAMVSGNTLKLLIQQKLPESTLVRALPIDLTRYPGDAHPLPYPVWWLRIKLWALIAPLASEEIRYALKLSLISCTITTILSLWVAVPFGYLMSRFNFFGKALIDAILDIPIVLPPLVVGLALLILFQQTSVGLWMEESFQDLTEALTGHRMGITFAVPSVIIAQFAVACAFAVRTMRVTFDQISPRQEQVALTLGCSRGQAFWKIVFPEARRGMVTAATLAWARSLGEFGPILVFSGTTRMRTGVLPTAVYLELNIGNIETAVAVSMLMIVAAAIVLIIVRVFGLEKAALPVK